MDNSAVSLQREYMPPEYLALEKEIRRVRSFQDGSVSEDRMQEIVGKVALESVKFMIMASCLRPLLHVESVSLVARAAVIGKDLRLGVLGTHEDATQAVRQLKETVIGQESLLRVMQVVSLRAIRNAIPWTQPVPSLREIQQATIFFAAQPLLCELVREGGYRQERSLGVTEHAPSDFLSIPEVG